MSAANRSTRINAAALEALMERSGYNAGTLAAACDPPITRSYVSNILAGRRQPSAEVAIRLARALRVPLAAILAEPDEEVDA